MKTFDQFMEHKKIEPLISQAAGLMVEADVDPSEYLLTFFENAYIDAAHGQARQAGSSAVDSLYNLGRAGANTGIGLGKGAWDMGSKAAGAIQKSALGQKVSHWWQDFQSPDRKFEKATGLITQAMNDPLVHGLDTSVHDLLGKMIQDLSKIAAQTKTQRFAAAGRPVPGAAPGAPSSPAPAPTPGGSSDMDPPSWDPSM